MTEEQYCAVIGGNSFYLVVENGNTAHIERVEATVQEHIKELEEKYPMYSQLRLITLAALQISDELIKLRDEFSQIQKEVEMLTGAYHDSL